MRRKQACALALLTPLACGGPATGERRGGRPASPGAPEASAGPPASPEVFAPGVISGSAHDAAPAFSPDGRTLYFQRSQRDASTILTSRLRDGRWAPPEIAPFSGEWNDMEPAFSPDGSFLVFVSSRPARAGGDSIDGHFGGKVQAGGGGNLWRVERRGEGWGAPTRLPDAVNQSTSVYAPSIVADGSLYFMVASPETGRFRIVRSQLEGGSYQRAEPVSFSDGAWQDVDPAVAPDESFAVFASSRPPTSPKNVDLFIVFRSSGRWGEPRHLGPSINTPLSDAEPRLGRDGRTLYFSSERSTPPKFPRTRAEAERDLARIDWDNGNYNIFRVDLTPWLTPPLLAKAALLVRASEMVTAASGRIEQAYEPGPCPDSVGRALWGMATFVLIHGAGDVGWYWHLVEAELRARGHDTLAPDLPCDDQAAGLPEYASTVVKAIGDRRDLVIVGHSMGGFTASLVCDRVAADLLVLVAPMIPTPGDSPASYWTSTGHDREPRQKYESDIDTFYNDVPPGLAAEALGRGRAQAEARLGEPWPLGAWPNVPTRVLIGRDDRVFPPSFLRRVAGERLGIEPDEIDGGHCMALSRPRELADRLESYAATVSRRSLRSDDTGGGPDAR